MFSGKDPKFQPIRSEEALSWGVATQKEPKKPEKKTVPNLKFAVAFGFFRFFCGTFSVFFGLNFDKKFQPFKNHVNNEILGGQELPNNTLNA